MSEIVIKGHFGWSKTDVFNQTLTLSYMEGYKSYLDNF